MSLGIREEYLNKAHKLQKSCVSGRPETLCNDFFQHNHVAVGVFFFSPGRTGRYFIKQSNIMIISVMKGQLINIFSMHLECLVF